MIVLIFFLFSPFLSSLSNKKFESSVSCIVRSTQDGDGGWGRRAAHQEIARHDGRVSHAMSSAGVPGDGLHYTSSWMYSVHTCKCSGEFPFSPRPSSLPVSSLGLLVTYFAYIGREVA